MDEVGAAVGETNAGPSRTAAALRAPAPPRVSVVLIFLDAAAFLAEAVDSVLAQTFADLELILVDDGSTDGSSEIARGYADRRHQVRCLEHPGHANRGMSASRNLGVGAARGELVAFIDADDVWAAHKLAEQVRILDAYPEAGLVAGAIRCRGTQWNGGAPVEVDLVRPTGPLQDRLVRPPAALRELYPIGPCGGPNPSDILVRRALVQRIGGFEEEFPGFGEDFVFMTKFLLDYPAYFSTRNWTLYRLHPGSCVGRIQRDGSGREHLRRVLLWIERYLRDRPDVPRALRRRLAYRLLPLRFPVLDYPRRLAVATLPRRLRDRLRAQHHRIGITRARRRGAA